MTTSDIITLVSLLIAIVAVINEKHRNNLFLRFSYLDYFIIALSFLLINYFCFYEGFEKENIFFDSLFFNNNYLPKPATWGYLIALFLLGYVGFIIQFSFYPNYNMEKVIVEYQRLLYNDEIENLYQYIEKYHQSDLDKYLKTSKITADTDDVNEFVDKKPLKKVILSNWENTYKNINSFSWSNRNNFANILLFKIISDDHFIKKSANRKPYIFTALIKEFKSDNRWYYREDIANKFLAEIIYHKNDLFKSELIKSSEYSSYSEYFLGKNKIIGALITDLSVAENIEVWQPFGDLAKAELREEKVKGYNSRLLEVYTSDITLWDYRCMFSIEFFNVLIVHAINTKYDKYHFWLFYYDRIAEGLIKILDNSPIEINDREPLNAHELLNKIFNNVFYWLDNAIEKQDNFIYSSIISCIGELIFTTFNSPNFSEAKKLEVLDVLLNAYCNIDKKNIDREGKSAEQIALDVKYYSLLENILLKPVSHIKSTHNYFAIIKTAWAKFDKIPHNSYNDGIGDYEDEEYFKRLKENVINPLGLDS